MATNTAGNTARHSHDQSVRALRKDISYADGVANVYTIGTLPAGALILKGLSGVQVTTVFNAGTANVLDIGSSADDDLLATDLALGALAHVPLDEAIGGFLLTADTTITATLALTGTAPTTGAGVIVIAYVESN